MTEFMGEQSMRHDGTIESCAVYAIFVTSKLDGKEQ